MSAPRAYGPHRESDAPQLVTVLAAGKRPDRAGYQVPIPVKLQRQRARLNNRAHELGRRE